MNVVFNKHCSACAKYQSQPILLSMLSHTRAQVPPTNCEISCINFTGQEAAPTSQTHKQQDAGWHIFVSHHWTMGKKTSFQRNNSVFVPLRKLKWSQWENRGDGVVTYPCQCDGPEGYGSPVPASERPGHQAQARAWQANKNTPAHKDTHTLSQTHTTPFTDRENLLTTPKNVHVTLQAAD